MSTRKSDGIDFAARSRSRRRALQAIYAWQMSGTPLARLLEEFAHEQDMNVADAAYFEDLVTGVVRGAKALDEALSGFLDRGIDQVDPIERGVLRIAAYEMLHRPDVPYRVVINEAIETTKRFGADHGHSYINGVLDKAAAQWRAVEAEAARKG
ncbi:transcription antitermination factor NusB [Alkalisalibacterium limincola]|uniref:Transcription antitermination protein NusB n=1 Tax=Alkalisalibacterium limincola TaxID=2699169 RepID=A0A5C8KZF7_9GAMM|nr:transcription antitermination factor NusB [Alkalisalibacterium limincola]TXK65007.1 transcription antitermination factor NusB [Alkalisalibacterium limincola]